MVSSSTLSLMHPFLCTSTHLTQPLVFLSWCFHICPFLSFSTSPSWLGPHHPVSPSYKMRSLDLTILKVPLSSDAVWSFSHEDHAWNVTSSKATISSLFHDPQEIFPDGIINLFEIVFKIFSNSFLTKFLKTAQLRTLGTEDSSRQHPDASSRR